MEEKQAIYTYGNNIINATELISLLQPYHINCVVDCRPLSNTPIATNTPLDELKKTLQQHHIVYIPFFKHFGLFPNSVRNKQGDIVFKKVILTENFLQGVERINIGIQKGYNICVIDNQIETYKSKRFTLIGEYLKDTYNILHLYPCGYCYTQELVKQKIDEFRLHRKHKINDAHNLGQTGEDLAALYLTQNGYQILDHNWNLHRGCELDIVARKDNKLHFIEVKTRTSDKYGEPQTAINYKKIRNIAKAIRQYCYQRRFFNIESQIDSIAIIYRADNDYDLKHLLGIRTDGNACDACNTYYKRP